MNTSIKKVLAGFILTAVILTGLQPGLSEMRYEQRVYAAVEKDPEEGSFKEVVSAWNLSMKYCRRIVFRAMLQSPFLVLDKVNAEVEK